jgi:hypothetical protein
MKHYLSALAVIAATLTLNACTEIPQCSSTDDLDCNYGAYSEERTYDGNRGTTNNFNKKPEPVIEAAPAPEPMPAVETTTEPIPEPIDTQVMQKADDKPMAKGLK